MPVKNNRGLISIIVTLGLALAGATFLIGSHLGNASIHEKGTMKEERIHGIIDREVSPWLTHIIEEQNKMKAQLDRIERKLDDHNNE